ncbi:hypothetical protein POM88_015440 [Heracleum sosnowskyi]|uniref:DNA helicase n=1 Tax=Heracleum sosnowskyi TaxID=360622 RepID=A0AAD8IK70_9APIA|nr:hypothetical protein POM88_015440 [Heracleum sosnowskyi]
MLGDYSFNDWQLFSSEDMMKGNKPRKRRQSRICPGKENMDINSSGTYISTMSPQSTIFTTPQLNHEILSCKATTTPTMSLGSSRDQFKDVQHNQLHDSLTRAPLSNITNVEIESRNKKKKNKGKAKVSTDFTDSARNLFESDFNKESHQSTNEYHDQLENSIIEDTMYGYGSSDDSNYDFCNDEIDVEGMDIDLDDNVQYNTCPPPKKNKRASIIPEEYASLGAPTAECIKCKACLWKEERVNKNVTRGTPIFSQCCKKGEVKLPDALPTPPYMLLFADPDSEKDGDMISMKDYYSYRFQVRQNEGMTARLGGRLFQQYMLSTEIKKKSFFGVCVGIMYVVEFQKRGLPHNPKSPCMKGFKCIRHFPKKYCPRTVFDESGFPLYRRRRLNVTVQKGKAELDNQDACKEYGLLEDDKEWHEVLDQCAVGGLSAQIRQLFVHIIVNCKVTDLSQLWNCHWKHMIDDILLKRRNITQIKKLILNDKQLEFYALSEIDDLLRSIGKCLKNYPQLPQPPQSYLNHGNMRLSQGTNVGEDEELRNFAQWVLAVGDGKVYPPPEDIVRCVADDIVIPPEFCDLEKENSVDNMIAATYPDFENHCKDAKYLSERAILTPTNQTVTHLNSQIVEKLRGESISYFSVDSAEEFGGTEADLNNAFPVEYLNSINIAG